MVYFVNDDNPIEDIPGSNISLLSCRVNECNKGFRMRAKKVAEAAFKPGVFEKASIITPIEKAHNINVFFPALELNINMKKIYKKGVPYPLI